MNAIFSRNKSAIGFPLDQKFDWGESILEFDIMVMKLTSYRFFKSVNFFQAILQSRGLTANHSESFQLYKRNECVSVDNNGMNRIFFVAKGKVKLFQSLPNGRELVKAIVLPGQLFTENSICEESRKTDYARVMDEDTAILCIQYRPVQ